MQMLVVVVGETEKCVFYMKDCCNLRIKMGKTGTSFVCGTVFFENLLLLENYFVTNVAVQRKVKIITQICYAMLYLSLIKCLTMVYDEEQ